jgi:hypothetical protein
MRCRWIPLGVLGIAVACTRTAERSEARGSRATRQLDEPRVCTTPRGGLVFSQERVGLFSTRSTLSEVDRLCDVRRTVLYDDVGWQAPAEEFAFLGARITAVQSRTNGRLRADVTPDLWTAAGDSLRLDDGQLVPRTLGELRTRYGRAIVDDNADPGGDDFPGFGARSCHFPYILFKLGFGGRGIIPDSTHITGVEMWIPSPAGQDRPCRR